MEQRTSAAARIFAALALVAALLIVILIIASAMNGGGAAVHHRSTHHAKKATKHRTKAETYTVQTGDTLTSIAHRTGVPVAELLALNPEVDPQILIAGQTLKLK
jgi:LysM repeat protein